MNIQQFEINGKKYPFKLSFGTIKKMMADNGLKNLSEVLSKLDDMSFVISLVWYGCKACGTFPFKTPEELENEIPFTVTKATELSNLIMGQMQSENIEPKNVKATKQVKK